MSLFDQKVTNNVSPKTDADPRDISAGECPNASWGGCVIHDTSDIDEETGKLGVERIIIDVRAYEDADWIPDEETVGVIAEALIHERLHYLWPVKYLDSVLPDGTPVYKDDEEHEKVRKAANQILKRVFGRWGNLHKKIGKAYPHPTDELVWIVPTWPLLPIH
ncbi:MAG: hypothetical protein F4039_08065 [Gammaproteobacteria bacterium]|nr:hypothetical protein [Gammaproteobacteria bacterium]